MPEKKAQIGKRFRGIVFVLCLLSGLYALTYLPGDEAPGELPPSPSPALGRSAERIPSPSRVAAKAPGKESKASQRRLGFETAAGASLQNPTDPAAPPAAAAPPPQSVTPTATPGISWLTWADGRQGLRYELTTFDINEYDKGQGRFSRIAAQHHAMRKTPGGPRVPLRRINVPLSDDEPPRVALADGDYREIRLGPPEAALGFIVRSADGGSAPVSARPSRGTGLHPREVIRTATPFNLRQVRGSAILLSPFQYDYERGMLRVWTRIDLIMEGVDAEAPFAELPAPFATFAEQLFVQPAASVSTRGSESDSSLSIEDSSATTGTSETSTRSAADSSPGRLLVIAADKLLEALPDFLQWKQQRGVTVSVLGYPSETGSAAAGVASAIQTAYDQQAITHVLLLGDADLLPVHSADDNPTDIRYACTEGSDLVRDVFISRISANTVAEAAYQFANAIGYEKHPDTTDPAWYRKASFIGSAEGENKAGSVFNMDDWQLLDLEREKFTSYGYSDIDRMYDHDQDNPDPFPGGSPGPEDILSAWNEGRSIIYYLGHGTENKWVTGSFYSSDVQNGLNNAAKLPFIMDSACINGDFTWSTADCIAEVIMAAGQDSGGGGAVGIISATEDVDWDPPIVILQAFTEQLIAGSLNSAGALHSFSVQAAMDWCESSEGPGALAAEQIMEQVHLLGDPTLGIRSKRPVAASVTHSDLAMPGGTFKVTLTETASGNPIQGVDICLYHADGIQLTARTDSAGAAAIAVVEDASIMESLLLTVYAPNLVPIQKDIAVNSGPLRFADFAAPPVLVDRAYEADLPVMGGTPPYTWSTADVLPAGLLLGSDSGSIHGSATETGSWDGTVTVEDAGGTSASAAVHLDIASPVQISTSAATAAEVDTLYSFAMVATDGFSPHAWSVVSGELPPGLALSAEGELAGTPSRAGDYAFTVRAEGAAGSFDESSLTLAVAPNPLLSIHSEPLPSADPLTDYSYSFTASGGAGGGYTWQLAAGTLPPELTLSQSGLLSGVPDLSGHYEFTVQVQDDATPATTAALDTALQVNAAVQILTTTLPEARLSEPYETALEIAGTYTPFNISLQPAEPTVNEETTSTYADIAADFDNNTPDAHWSGDEKEWTFDLGFSFPYFGHEYTQIRVGDNGYAVFGDSSPAPMWEATADQLAEHPMMAPFWTDLVFTSDPDDGVFVRANSRSATILWRGSDYHYENDRSCFALTLHADGRFRFHYDQINTTNRVVVGFSDGTAKETETLYSQTWNADNPLAIEGWTEHVDIHIQPPSYPPAWLSVSDSGILRGTPAQSGVFPFLLDVTDAAGYQDRRILALQVDSVSPADSNEDDDVNNAEILAFIERWKRGEVTRSQVETAVAIWREGPGSTGRSSEMMTDWEMFPNSRRSTRNTAPSAALLRARALRANTPLPSESSTESRGQKSRAETARRRTLSSYQSAADIDSILRDLAAQFANICRYQSIGHSQMGRPIGALLISDAPRKAENEPAIGIVGAMHGDEPIAADIPLALAQTLLHSYDDNTTIREIVNSTEVWILPCLNPDGLAAGTRTLTDSQDLNRIFPDGTDLKLPTPWSAELPGKTGCPESQALMDWAAQQRLTALLSFHSGTEVVCYPFGNNPSGSSIDTPSPDDDLFRILAADYASNSVYIAAESPFAEGIVNGAEWYAVRGEMTDWLYRRSGCLAMTVELSTAKAPAASEVAEYWEWNRPALLEFLRTLQTAVQGRVIAADSGVPLDARITVAEHAQAVFSDPLGGDFHRLLPAGRHRLTVEAFGYQSQSRDVEVLDAASPPLQAFRLQPAPLVAVRRFDLPQFTPGRPLTTSIDLQIQAETPAPPALIVQEAIPDGWSYLSGSTGAGRESTAPGEPRIENGRCSWLIWGEGAARAAFRFDWDVPADSAASVAFEGDIHCATMRTPLLGINRLAQILPGDSGFVLHEGWNLISLDLQPASSAPADLFSGMKPLPQVWHWDGREYVRPETMEPGRGYWVYSSASRTVRYEGNYETSALRTLQPGWNLLGPLANRDAFLDRADVTSVLSWSSPSYHGLPSVESNRGYWVFMDAEAVISLR